MKKILLTLLFTLSLAQSLKAQIVNIPDPNFKTFLVNHSYNNNPSGAGWSVPLDQNGDGEIQYSEAATYPSDVYNHAFFLQGLNIHDLTGIEAFHTIEWINAPDNPLTTLNITGCLALKKLSIGYGNTFTTLTLVNPTLESLDVSCPTMTSVDLSGCPGLKILNCSNSSILTNLNVNGCNLLEELRVNFNPVLGTLNMGQLYNLKLFQCYSNQLTSLDVSSCHALQYFYCTGNPLTSLNLANGNPQSFSQIVASGFPDLTCIKVNNAAVSEYLWLGTGGYYEFDEWVTFNTDCTPPGPCTITIPDANFKAKLVQNAALNTNGNTEIECSEAEAYTGTINVDNSEISDMTGIKLFPNITALSCNGISSYYFNTLDVSGLHFLTSVSCNGSLYCNSINVSNCPALTNFSVDTIGGNNALNIDASGCTALTGFTVATWASLSLDLSGCTALSILDMPNKNLVALDITNCSALTSLICNTNQLTELNLMGCNALSTINCSNNSITSLAVGSALPLTNLDCSYNQLTSLNVLDNTNLALLNCSDNHLPYLLVSNNTDLTWLNCSNNSIGYLDVNNNPDLVGLNCSHNNLSSLNVNSNVALSSFDCSFNNLNSQNVTLNTALFFFNCSNNNISSQNVSLNTALLSLYCGHNNLQSIDLSNTTNLKYFDCSQNQLPALNVNACPQLLQMDCSHNELTELNLSAQTNLVLLGCGQNQLTTLDMSTTNCILFNADDNTLTSLNLANGSNQNWLPPSALNNPGLYCVQVDDAEWSAENWSGDNFAFDPIVSFSENCALSVVAPDAASISVYPNPTTGLVHFSKPVHVVLYNRTGQKIGDKQNVDTIDLSAQASGIYLMAIFENGKLIGSRKIVKI